MNIDEHHVFRDKKDFVMPSEGDLLIKRCSESDKLGKEFFIVKIISPLVEKDHAYYAKVHVLETDYVYKSVINSHYYDNYLFTHDDKYLLDSM